MFQICIQERWPCIIFLIKLSLNAMIKTSKYKILLILLEFQNLWNLINVLIKNNL
jgi:hypothetical protein